MAISTTSFNLTPQATSDTFVYTEDTSGVLTLDVMSNDLGGAAKTLYSLDDGLENDGTTGSDLLIKDTTRAETTSSDTSLNGAKIWITSDGKVGYDSSTLSTSFKAALQALGDGQTMTDTFTYAIRLANGTLSWTTATVVYTGVNDAPVLTDPANISFTDTSAADTFSAATGTLHATDVDSPTITFGLTGSAADNSLAGYNVSKASAYGTMYLNTTTGAYTFVPNGAAINGLHAGDTPALNFEFTASDGSLSSAQTLTVNITGANDNPTLTNPTDFSFTDTSAHDSFSAQSGTLSAADVDSASSGFSYALTGSVADNTHTGFNLAATSAYGTMYLNSATGAYEFVANASAIDALQAGDNPTASFTFTVNDGDGGSASQTLDVNITGANDAPTLTDPTDIGITDTIAADSFSPTTGSLAAADVDSASSGFSYDVNGSSADNTHTGFDLASSSAYGTMYLNSATGAYEFVADDAAVNALQDGDNPSVTFTFTVYDGDGGSATQTLDVNITGANDAPTLTDPTDINITDTVAADSFSPSTGSLVAADVDSASSGFSYDVNGSVADNTHVGFDLASSSAYGTMYLNSSTGAYEFVADDAAINALQAGDNPTVSFTFTVNDGDGGSASQTLDVNITGANDAPTLTNPTDFSFTDTSAHDSFSAQSGTLSAADVDSASSGFTYALTGSVADNTHTGFNLAATSAYGTMYLNSATGAYEFVADDAAVNALQAGDNPTASFTFTVNDGDGGSATQTLDVNITGANDAPTLTDPTDISITDTIAADSFSASTGSLVAADVDSSGFSYALTGSVADNTHTGFNLAATSAYGTMYLNSATGAYEFIANDAAINALQAGDNPTASFTFTVYDGDGGSATQTLDVNITGANDAPTLTDPTDIGITDTVAADSFSAQTGSLVAADVDSASSGFSYDVNGSAADNTHPGFDLAATSAYGTMYLNSATGAYEFVANDAAVNALQAGHNPTVSFTFTVNDGDGGSASQTLDVNITGANDAPTLTDPTDISITDTIAADSFSAQTGSLVAADVDSASSGFSYALTGGVADNTHTGFNLAATSAYGTMYLNSSTGAYEFVANASAIDALQAGHNPTVTFTFTVYDGDGGSASQTLGVNITGANDAPTLTDPTDISVTDTIAADSFSPTTGSLVAADVDSASSGFSYALTGGVADNTHTGFDLAATSPYGTMYLNSATGAYEFVANDAAIDALQAGHNPTASFTFTVNDGDGGSATQTLDVNITGANDAPTLTDPTDISVTDTIAADSFSPTTGSLVAADVDSTGLTYDVNGSGADNSHVGFDLASSSAYGTMYLNSSTGAYEFVANDAAVNALQDGDNPSVTFTFTVNDGDGGSATQTLDVNITGANDAPIINEGASNLAPSGSEDNAILGSIVAGDVDNAALSFSAPAQGDPNGPVHGSVSFDSSGGYTYTPDANYNGSDSFTVTVSDGVGGSDTVVVNVTVAPVNDAPVLSDPTDISVTDTVAADSFSAQTGSLVAADVDSASSGFSYDVNGSGADNTHTGFDLAATSAYGTMYLNSATGAYEFVADDAAVNALQAGDNPTASFTFTVNDGDGGSATQTLDVNITGANDAPTLTDPTDISITDTIAADSFSASTGSLVAADVDSSGFSYDVNGSGADNTHTGFDLAATSAYGTMYLNSSTGAYEFVADAAAVNALQVGDNPTVSFTFTVNDGDGGSDSQTLDVNITGANDAPIINEGASNLAPSGSEDNAILGSIVAGDVDNGTLSFSAPAQGDPNGPVHGSVSFDSSGGYTYTPDANYNGSDSFTVTVSDGAGGSDTVVVNVTVAPVNDAPVLSDPTDITYTDTSAADNFVGVTSALSASDIDGDTLSYSLTGAGADLSLSGYNVSKTTTYGTMYLNTSTGAYHYEPNDTAINAVPGGSNPTDSFTFGVSDGHGGSDSQTLDVHITGANDITSPVAPAVYNGTDDPNDFDTAPLTAILFSSLSTSQLNSDNSIKGTTGADIIDAGGGVDTVYGLAGDDSIHGGQGVDTIYGGEGNDTIIGDQDNDVLYGGSGNDTINGIQGADNVIGGYGADTLTGDSGNDTFIYLSTKDTGDTITDFVHGTDKINLSAIDANTALANDQAFTFVAVDTNAVQANSVTFHYDSVAGVTHVWADVNGDTTADLQIDLTGNITLSSGDFIL